MALFRHRSQPGRAFTHTASPSFPPSWPRLREASKKHVGNLCAKLGIGTGTEAVTKARELHLPGRFASDLVAFIKDLGT